MAFKQTKVINFIIYHTLMNTVQPVLKVKGHVFLLQRQAYATLLTATRANTDCLNCFNYTAAFVSV